ncbi:MAG: hypothetical protein QMD04_06260 [Anaerolineales bacterium]|nr:hypothetical protein [Anaerolineales bacterium]
MKFKAHPTILPVALLLSLACGSGTPSAPVTPTQTSQLAASQLATPNSQFGIAGLIPRNFPNSSAADWTNLYETLPETGELLGAYTDWADSPETAGQIPAVVDTVFGLAPRYHFIPLIALGFFRDKPEGGLELSLALTNAEERAKFKHVAVAIVEKHQPSYLALGIEINRYYEHDPTGFDAFVTLYTETYEAVKAASPDTLVFPVFQYEMLHGGEFFAGDGQNPSQWELLDLFGERLDLVAFTTYPYLLYASPDDLPANYYAVIAEHTSRPIAFSEIGWPSAPFANAPDLPYGGSQDEQAAFVRRFFELANGLDLSLALWSFPHDPAGRINPAFLSISLRHNNGTSKPALAVWQEMIHSLP